MQSGRDGGWRVGEVRAGTTSPMPDHKGFKLLQLVNFQKFSTLRVKMRRQEISHGMVEFCFSIFYVITCWNWIKQGESATMFFPCMSEPLQKKSQVTIAQDLNNSYSMFVFVYYPCCCQRSPRHCSLYPSQALHSYSVLISFSYFL